MSTNPQSRQAILTALYGDTALLRPHYFLGGITVPTTSTLRSNRFLGWADIELTEDGEKEARKAAHTLAHFDVHVDEVFCSYLKRSIKSAWLLADEMNQVCTCS